MQARGDLGSLSQQLGFSTIHNLGQTHTIHPGENEHTLLRQVGGRQTKAVAVWLAVLIQGPGVPPDLLAKFVRIHFQRIGTVLTRARAHLRPQNEPVRMDAQRGAAGGGGVETGRQHAAQNLQHRRRLLQARQLRPQSRALLGSRLESEAHTRDFSAFIPRRAIVTSRR